MIDKTIRPDLTAVKRFLKVLDPKASFFTFQVATDAESKDKPNPDPLARKPLHLAPDDLGELVKLNQQGAAVWVCVNATDGRGRTAKNITRVRAVFADIDGQVNLAKLKQHDPEPSLIVRSSRGRYQVYWLTDLPLEKFKAVQRSITEIFHSDHVIDPSRVLRVPGFYHQKAEPYQVKLVHKGPAYTAKEVLAAFPPVVSEGVDHESSKKEGEWSPLPKPLSAAMLAKYEKLWKKIFDQGYEFASELDFALAKQAASVGWSETKAAALIRAVRKDDKSARASYVWRTVKKAYGQQQQKQRKAAGNLPTMSEFMRITTPKLGRVVEPLLLHPGLSMLHGDPGSGKTPLAASIAYAVATGKSLMDWKVKRAHPVLYVDNELPIAQLKTYLRRVGRWSKNLYIANIEDLMVRELPGLSLATEDGRAEIDHWIRKYKATFVVLDSLFTLAPPDAMTEDKHQWKEIAAWLLKHKFAGRHVMLLHHDNKGGQQYGTMLKTIHFDITLQIKKRPEFDVEGGEVAVGYEFRIGKQRYLFGLDVATRIITSTIIDDRTRQKGEFVVWQRTDHDPTSSPKRRGGPSLATIAAERLIEETDKTDAEIAEMVGLSRAWVGKLRKRLAEETQEPQAADDEGEAL